MNNEREALQKIIRICEENELSGMILKPALIYIIYAIAKNALVVNELTDEDRSMRYLLPRVDQ